MAYWANHFSKMSVFGEHYFNSNTILCKNADMSANNGGGGGQPKYDFEILQFCNNIYCINTFMFQFILNSIKS